LGCDWSVRDLVELLLQFSENRRWFMVGFYKTEQQDCSKGWRMNRLIMLLLSMTLSGAALAQPVQHSVAIVNSVQANSAIAYSGTMTVAVDATDIARRIFRVEQTIPVAKPGRMTLLFPKWLPGTHGQSGQLEKLAGLTIQANGQTLTWTRDALDMYAFHVVVPAGASQINASFQFLSALNSEQGRVVVTREMMNIQWPSVSLYPAGYRVDRIPVSASVKYLQSHQATV
jgi:hypothetical protein